MYYTKQTTYFVTLVLIYFQNRDSRLEPRQNLLDAFYTMKSTNRRYWGHEKWTKRVWKFFPSLQHFYCSLFLAIFFFPEPKSLLEKNSTRFRCPKINYDVVRNKMCHKKEEIICPIDVKLLGATWTVLYTCSLGVYKRVLEKSAAKNVLFLRWLFFSAIPPTLPFFFVCT